jgi:hypothetical protein
MGEIMLKQITLAILMIGLLAGCSSNNATTPKTSNNNSNTSYEPPSHLDLSGLSTNDAAFVQFLNQGLFPQINAGSNRITSILTDMDNIAKTRPLTQSEKNGENDAITSASAIYGNPVSLTIIHNGNKGSIWLGSDNPNIDNPQLKAYAIGLRHVFQDLINNSKGLYNTDINDKSNSKKFGGYLSKIGNDFTEISKYETALQN